METREHPRPETTEPFFLWAKYVAVAFAALLAGIALMIFVPQLRLTPAGLVSLVVPNVSLFAVRAAYRAGYRDANMA